MNLKFPLLLAASPHLFDPIFQQSVILLTKNDKWGSLGFVLNNKSPLTLDEVLANKIGAIPPNIPVWNAGPVECTSGWVLHNQLPLNHEEVVADGIFISSSQDSIKKMVEFNQRSSSTFKYPYRLLIGYAGWGKGQLEREMTQGAWIHAPLDHAILFNEDHQNMWQKTLESVGISNVFQIQSHQTHNWIH